MGDIVLAIIEVLKTALFWFIPWTVLDVYERGVLLRLGRPVTRNGSEVIGPGLIWHYPFNIDVVSSTNVVFETGDAELQCQTMDDITVNIEVVVGYSISNPRKFLLEIEEAGDAVLDALGGGIYIAVRQRTWEQLDSSNFIDELRSEVSRRGVRFGVKIESIYIHSLTRLGLKYGVLKVVNVG